MTYEEKTAALHDALVLVRALKEQAEQQGRPVCLGPKHYLMVEYDAGTLADITDGLAALDNDVRLTETLRRKAGEASTKRYRSPWLSRR